MSEPFNDKRLADAKKLFNSRLVDLSDRSMAQVYGLGLCDEVDRLRGLLEDTRQLSGFQDYHSEGDSDFRNRAYKEGLSND